MGHFLDQFERKPETPTLSDAQFARIEELLLPGYELSKLMLAQYQAQAAAPSPTTQAPTTTPPASTDEPDVGT
jgi:hypothetical protein